MHGFTNYETRLLSQITHCYLGGGVFIAASRKTHEQVQNKERTNRLTKCQRQADTYCWPLPRSVSGRQLELHSNHSRSDDASCQTIPETSANAWSSPFTLMLLHFVRPTAVAFANERAKSSFAGQLSEGLLSIRRRHEQKAAIPGNSPQRVGSQLAGNCTSNVPRNTKQSIGHAHATVDRYEGGKKDKKRREAHLQKPKATALPRTWTRVKPVLWPARRVHKPRPTPP